MNKAPTTLKALLIDLDGTLVDTIPLLFKIYQKFLRKYGIEGTPEEFDELNGPSLAEVIAILQKRYQLKGDLSSLLKHYKQEIILSYASLPLFPHALEAMARAKKNQLKIALVSSASKEFVEKVILQNATAFDALITPEGLLKSKPAPDIYQKALMQLKTDPKEAIAIEDSRSGIQSARQAGIFTLWITHQGTQDTGDPCCIQVTDWKAIDHFLERYYG